MDKYKYVGIGALVLVALVVALKMGILTRSESDASSGPVAVMTATPGTGEAPLTVNFDGSQSYDPDNTYPVSYSWDFGDGTRLGDTSPLGGAPATVSHTYGAVGTYVAKLTATDWDDISTSATVSTNIVVNASTTNKVPVPVISVNPLSGNAPLTVAFNGTGSYDTDGTITKYSWNFGDGATATGATVSHTYPINPNVSVYLAKLTVTDDSGLIGSGYKTISVNSTTTNQTPVAKMTATPSTGPAPLTVSFNGSGSSDVDGTIASYVWDFGDGTTGTGVSVSHYYTTALNYIAKLTVTDNGGKTNSTSSDVIVTSTPIPTTLTAPSNLKATANKKVVTLTWADKSNNEEGFYVERAVKVSNPVYQRVGEVTANSIKFTETLTTANTYLYRVQAFNKTTNTTSGYSTTASIRVR